MYRFKDDVKNLKKANIAKTGEKQNYIILQSMKRIAHLTMFHTHTHTHIRFG